MHQEERSCKKLQGVTLLRDSTLWNCLTHSSKFLLFVCLLFQPKHTHNRNTVGDDSEMRRLQMFMLHRKGDEFLEANVTDSPDPVAAGAEGVRYRGDLLRRCMSEEDKSHPRSRFAKSQAVRSHSMLALVPPKSANCDESDEELHAAMSHPSEAVYNVAHESTEVGQSDKELQATMSHPSETVDEGTRETDLWLGTLRVQMHTSTHTQTFLHHQETIVSTFHERKKNNCSSAVLRPFSQERVHCCSLCWLPAGTNALACPDLSAVLTIIFQLCQAHGFKIVFQLQ